MIHVKMSRLDAKRTHDATFRVVPDECWNYVFEKTF